MSGLPALERGGLRPYRRSQARTEAFVSAALQFAERLQRGARQPRRLRRKAGAAARTPTTLYMNDKLRDLERWRPAAEPGPSAPAGEQVDDGLASRVQAADHKDTAWSNDLRRARPKRGPRGPVDDGPGLRRSHSGTCRCGSANKRGRIATANRAGWPGRGGSSSSHAPGGPRIRVRLPRSCAGRVGALSRDFRPLRHVAGTGEDRPDGACADRGSRP